MSKFTQQERAQMLDELRYSQPTHGFQESIDYNSREHYGTNANGSKYKKP